MRQLQRRLGSVIGARGTPLSRGTTSCGAMATSAVSSQQRRLFNNSADQQNQQPQEEGETANHQGTGGEQGNNGEEEASVNTVVSTFVKTAAAVRPPPPLPHFDVDFEIGTGRFTLIGSGPCQGVFVSCVVSAQHKPRVLQLLDSGDRSMMGDDGEEYHNNNNGNSATMRDLSPEARALLRQSAVEQQLYHKHLWTCAKQRLNINRRKIQRRREAAKVASVAANRAATLDAFLQSQHNQNYDLDGGDAYKKRTAKKTNATVGMGKIGKMSMMCPARAGDATPPAPESPIPPPPMNKHLIHQSRFLDKNADNNPQKAILSDPFEKERDLHRRQYLALDGMVAEDGAEQVPVRFRVGILAKRVGRKSDDATAAASTAAAEVEEEEEVRDAADVIADFMDGAPKSASASAPKQSPPSNTNGNSKARFTNTMLHLACSTISPAAALCIDTANFFRDPSVFLETSVENTDAELKGYLGPQLHQRHLALYACNREGSLNRYVFPHASGHLESVSTRNYYRADVFPEVSVADKGGHVPVHTVPPRLHDALRASVALRGVDDELALYVHRYAQYVFAQERLVWRQRLVSFLKRGRLSPTAAAASAAPKKDGGEGDAASAMA